MCFTRPHCRGPCCQGDRGAAGPVGCELNRRGNRGCLIPIPGASSTPLHTLTRGCLRLHTHTQREKKHVRISLRKTGTYRIYHLNIYSYTCFVLCQTKTTTTKKTHPCLLTPEKCVWSRLSAG